MQLDNCGSTVHFVCSVEYLPVSDMNTYSVISCLLALAVVASANPPLALSYAPIAAIDRIPNPSYNFNYAVNDPVTGDNKGQWEARHGDVVRGAYSLVEPDGNIRVVEYTADPVSGFNAVVKRTGPNIHSVALPAVKAIQPVITAPVHAPVVHAAPVVAQLAPIAPVVAPYIDPLIHTAPLLHSAPLLHTAPLLHDIPSLPWAPLSASPWLSLSGTTYGHKGHIVRRWATGPIDMHGNSVTIRTKH